MLSFRYQHHHHYHQRSNVLPPFDFTFTFELRTVVKPLEDSDIAYEPTRCRFLAELQLRVEVRLLLNTEPRKAYESPLIVKLSRCTVSTKP